ncbi:MAG: hypothetical protein KIS78_27560 [Labilithrix sp.]|nr:hypothetical protein [Labilithrix sp.]MCW5836188.1 hypothetical protein [Labilithrix sp.]
MKKKLAPGIALAALLGLVTTVGCSSAPADEVDEDVASSEDALGQDPANCRFHHRYREWLTTCTYGNATLADQSAIVQAATHASGVGSCVDFVVTVAATASSASVGLVPLTVGGAARATATASGCALYIGTLLSQIIPTSCTSREITPSERKRGDVCAMACGGSQRLFNGDCYCGVGNPLACHDAAPTYTPTPGATSCFNRGNGTSVARGRCSLGYTDGAPNGEVYRCNGGGQDWARCPRGTSLDACDRGAACR